VALFSRLSASTIKNVVHDVARLFLSGRANLIFLKRAPARLFHRRGLGLHLAQHGYTACAILENLQAACRHWHPLFKTYSTPHNASYMSTVVGLVFQRAPYKMGLISSNFSRLMSLS
jgi:hypothetical protein